PGTTITSPTTTTTTPGATITSPTTTVITPNTTPTNPTTIVTTPGTTVTTPGAKTTGPAATITPPVTTVPGTGPSIIYKDIPPSRMEMPAPPRRGFLDRLRNLFNPSRPTAADIQTGTNLPLGRSEAMPVQVPGKSLPVTTSVPVQGQGKTLPTTNPSPV